MPSPETFVIARCGPCGAYALQWPEEVLHTERCPGRRDPGLIDVLVTAPVLSQPAGSLEAV
jgi:hypothetical protein